jgi:hypothetical protein
MIYVVAFISFFIGSFGYVFVRFLLMPIGRYKKLKRKASHALAIKVGKSGMIDSSSIGSKNLRKLSVELSECYTDDLPHWYKIYLETRKGEIPQDAARHIMALSNTKNPQHALSQIEKIKQSLNL